MVAEKCGPHKTIQTTGCATSKTYTQIVERPEVIVDDVAARQAEHLRVGVSRSCVLLFADLAVLHHAARPQFLVFHFVVETIGRVGLEVRNALHVADFFPVVILFLEPGQQFLVCQIAEDAGQAHRAECGLQILTARVLQGLAQVAVMQSAAHMDRHSVRCSSLNDHLLQTNTPTVLAVCGLQFGVCEMLLCLVSACD